MEDDGVIKEFTHYVVQVGQCFSPDKGGTELGYQIVNKATGVVEVERNILPEALVIARRLDEGLEEMLNGPKPEIAIATTVPVQKPN